MRHRAITAEEAKASIRTLVKMIHEEADKFTVTDLESLADAVAETIESSIRRPRKRRVKNSPRRPSRIIKSR